MGTFLQEKHSLLQATCKEFAEVYQTGPLYACANTTSMASKNLEGLAELEELEELRPSPSRRIVFTESMLLHCVRGCGGGGGVE
jgi:hypothetical protein